MRTALSTALQQAVQAGDKSRIVALRLVCAALQDREQAARAAGQDSLSAEEETQLLKSMISQHQQVARAYEEDYRLDLAEQEYESIRILSDFLPRQYEDDEVRIIVKTLVEETGARGLRDMGQVMAGLKERYGQHLDNIRASSLVREVLQG